MDSPITTNGKHLVVDLPGAASACLAANAGAYVSDNPMDAILGELSPALAGFDGRGLESS
jgi:hypothetical protein